MAHGDSRASSDLEAALAAEIRRRGPISIAHFMSLASQHPTLGSYRRADPLGRAGDFITAPEISQVFGEVIGLWLAQAWRELGQPASVHLIELGPGRGTLMADILRVARSVPDFHPSLQVHLVETSAPLRAAQRDRLADEEVHWYDDIADIPPGPTLLIANEFFDALPVHQLVRTPEGWVERCVGLSPSGTFTYVDEAEAGQLAKDVPGAADAPIGTVAEVSPARAALAAAIGRRLATDGGVALIIDYGAWVERPTGDTLQAVRAHETVDPLTSPGTADLSSHVDFNALAKAAHGAGGKVYGPVPQGPFLRALGIEVRTAVLLKRAAADQGRELRAALFRLTDASAMGELFKVLALSGPDDPHPPGFNAPTMATVAP